MEGKIVGGRQVIVECMRARKRGDRRRGSCKRIGHRRGA